MSPTPGGALRLIGNISMDGLPPIHQPRVSDFVSIHHFFSHGSRGLYVIERIGSG
ncbi:hypothetical protein KKI24_03535 [bacterium]|nr:hypothetical protein [bacterium]